MALVAVEARPLDFLEALGDDGQASAWRGKRLFGVTARQCAEGATATIRTEAGGLCLIVGLYPDPRRKRQAQAWLAVGPALKANLRASLVMARQLLDVAGAEAAPLEVRALIGATGVAGPRLARWLGFKPTRATKTALGPLKTFARRFP